MRSINVNLEAKDVAEIIKALHHRMYYLPISTECNGGENEFGSWVNWWRCRDISNTLTSKLAHVGAEVRGVPPDTRDYWLKFGRARKLIIHFVWPFKRREVA